MDDRNDAFELLKELLGPELALRVADSFAGTALYIPKNIITAERHRAIRKEFQDGADYRALAIRYGYTQSHIRKIVHEKKERINNGKA
jgi:Mor family transcriptional regulator